jgi:hypothetical protein
MQNASLKLILKEGVNFDFFAVSIQDASCLEIC